MNDGFGEAPACTEYGPRLAALLDGELPLDEQRQLEQHLRLCSGCSADLAQQRAARAALRRLAASLSAPPALGGRVQAGLAHAAVRATTRRRLLLLGSLAAALALLAAIAWLGSAGETPNQAMLVAVVDAHQRQTLGATPVTFSSSEPAAVAAWARSRAGGQIEVPPLDDEGYRLLGARPEPAVAPHAITLVYQGKGGRLTCTVLPVTAPLGLPLPLRPTTSPTHATRLQGSTVASWGDRDTAYVLVADLDPDVLLHLARLAAQSN